MGSRGLERAYLRNRKSRPDPTYFDEGAALDRIGERDHHFRVFPIHLTLESYQTTHSVYLTAKDFPSVDVSFYDE